MLGHITNKRSLFYITKYKSSMNSGLKVLKDMGVVSIVCEFVLLTCDVINKLRYLLNQLAQLVFICCSILTSASSYALVHFCSSFTLMYVEY